MIIVSVLDIDINIYTFSLAVCAGQNVLWPNKAKYTVDQNNLDPNFIVTQCNPKIRKYTLGQTSLQTF